MSLGTVSVWAMESPGHLGDRLHNSLDVLMPVSCTLKNGQSGRFTRYVHFITVKKKKTKGRKERRSRGHLTGHDAGGAAGSQRLPQAQKVALPGARPRPGGRS